MYDPADHPVEREDRVHTTITLQVRLNEICPPSARTDVTSHMSVLAEQLRSRFTRDMGDITFRRHTEVDESFVTAPDF